jgi:vacuolar iron transporter family protein
MDPSSKDSRLPAHFKGKEAIDHVAEAQAQGLVDSTEIHGTEIPGHLSAAADAARDTAAALGAFWLILAPLHLPFHQLFLALAVFTGGWLFWKAGRSAWLGWFRLERLHRVVAQEKWEIENHRQQEREELKALYAVKGFEGKLLEDVMDVLMADGDRLLRVMVEEELGLSLEAHEHPLKQSLGAALGSLIAGIICLLGLFLEPTLGLIIAAFLIIGASAGIAAHQQQNRLIPAIVWNLGLGTIIFGFIFFILRWLSLPT